MMTITLPNEIERIINEQMAGGHFDSPAEVLRAGLQLLEEQEQLRQVKIENLRREIMKGVEDKKAGRYKVYDSADKMIEEIIGEAKIRLTQERRRAIAELESKLACDK